MSMVLIDLSNFFNGLIAESSVGPGLTRAYFMDWLDLELLASVINPDPSASIGTWIFYSNRAMGRGPARLSAEELKEFAKRHNRISGISAIDVGIPGEQGESFRFTCSKCRAENDTQTQSEKGIDSSLITHLFDTMDHWKTATIVSQDADYVPAVRALRKRGKLVCGAGFIKRAADPLITECFEYKDVMDEYIREDLRLFLLFQKGGRLSQFVKNASSVDGISVSATIIATPTRNRVTWTLRVRRTDKNPIGSGHEDFLQQIKTIKEEFPYVIGRENGPLDSEIEIYVRLDLRQHASLKRISKRYLDFEVRGFIDVD
ncbi:MAG: NYN domain-containing protein [Candidatus Aminicenantes bacterium]|nr:NYN domain-containing protein [Candidatus Aminicenantes bacterium]